MSEQMDHEGIATQLGALLQMRGQCMATAESCTGGGIAQAVTAIPGSSIWFDRGFVTYSNASKSELLKVSPGLIEQHGAVSESVVKAMAQGALGASLADWVVAVSGVAGPGGGSVEKPIGTVWLAWQRRGFEPVTECRRFKGDRNSVRQQTVDRALSVLVRMVDSGLERD